MPEERDLNDYILVFPADSGIKPIYVYLKDDARNLPGTATGKGADLPKGQRWLDMSVTNSGGGAPIPAHIADKLRGRNYRKFDELRGDIWSEISKDPDLLSQFSPVNQDIISESGSPLSPKAGWYEGPKEVVKKFQIHHVKPIKDGGAVYDIDNLRVVTPRLHDEIHYRR